LKILDEIMVEQSHPYTAEITRTRARNVTAVTGNNLQEFEPLSLSLSSARIVLRP